MLARYKMYRGKRPDDDPLPNGIRQDTRWRTRHPLRPTEQIVTGFLQSPGDAAWEKLYEAYLALLDQRFREDRSPFDDLAELARTNDVFLGCSCPTTANPRVEHCHTWLALEFMKRKYPKLRVKFPPISKKKT